MLENNEIRVPAMLFDCIFGVYFLPESGKDCPRIGETGGERSRAVLRRLRQISCTLLPLC